MDLVRTSPVSAGINSPSLPRKPHHPTSHEGVDVPAQNGTPQHTFSGGLAFSCVAKVADKSSPTAGTKVDDGGQMTYAELIRIAFLSSTTKQMGLRELYKWFKQNTNRANGAHEGWKNSVRSNLCLNQVRGDLQRK